MNNGKLMLSSHSILLLFYDFALCSTVFIDLKTSEKILLMNQENTDF